jgi:hypothetical protein
VKQQSPGGKRRRAAPQLKPTQWEPGQSGNPLGRPRGSRHKLSQRFVDDVHELWLAEGRGALEACLRIDPVRFCTIVASLVPKEMKLDAGDLKTVVFDMRGVSAVRSEPIVIEDEHDEGDDPEA